MSANHSDCRYANRRDRVPVTGTRYTTYFIHFKCLTCNKRYAWFPGLRFRSSVHTGSSSIFSVVVDSRPGAPSTRKRGKLAPSQLGQPCLLANRHAHSAPKVRNGNGITATALRDGSTDTVLRKRLRKRIVMLETRR